MEGLYIPPRPKKWTKTRIAVLVISLVIGLFVLALIGYLLAPLVFMYSIELQRTIIFHRTTSPSAEEFRNFHQPAFVDYSMVVKDLDGVTNVSIGTWHLLPSPLAYEKIYIHPDLDFKEALKNGTYDVLLYLHGIGETRDSSARKYEVLRQNFHVITIDYRSFGDSTEAELTEEGVVNDCVQIYKLLKKETKGSIVIWGHSLGSAIATKTVALLGTEGIVPKALILEGPFTSLHDLLIESSAVKAFSILQWFQQTILDPLQQNGFVFDTASNLKNTTCPVMLLHAEGDPVVPTKFSEQLYEIAKLRNESFAQLHLFKASLKYGHVFIYQDPFLPLFIKNFMKKCIKNETGLLTVE